jgi:hypothetical protein
MDFAGKRAEDGADAGGVAQNFRSGDDEALSCTQDDGPATRERAGANLRALQVGENSDWFFLFDGGGAQRDDILRVLGMRTVRKIQAGDVHAGLQ